MAQGPFRCTFGLLVELVGDIHQDAFSQAEISRSVCGQGNEITGNASIGFSQSELRLFLDEIFGDFSLLFHGLGRHGPDIGVAVDALPQKAGPLEVPIQQLAETLEVQLLDVKRVFDTRFVRINSLVGGGNDEQSIFDQKPLDLIQEQLMLLDMLDRFKTDDDVKVLGFSYGDLGDVSHQETQVGLIIFVAGMANGGLVQIDSHDRSRFSGQEAGPIAFAGSQIEYPLPLNKTGGDGVAMQMFIGNRRVLSPGEEPFSRPFQHGCVRNCAGAILPARTLSSDSNDCVQPVCRD